MTSARRRRDRMMRRQEHVDGSGVRYRLIRDGDRWAVGGFGRDVLFLAGWIWYDPRGRSGGRRTRYACYVRTAAAPRGAYTDHRRTPADALALIASAYRAAAIAEASG